MKDGVGGAAGLGGEHGVEQAGLGLAEAEAAVVGGGAEIDEQAVLAEPVVGQHADRAVVERDHRVAAAGGFEDLGQGDVLGAEGDLAVELEPVHAAGDGELEVGGRAVEHALGADAPAVADQFADGLGDLLGGDFEGAGVEAVVLDGSEAELFEAFAGTGLGLDVAADGAAAVGLDGDLAGREGGDAGAVVVEFEFGDERVGAAGLHGGADGQAGRRRQLDLGEFEALDQLVERDAGLGHDPAEHGVLLGLGDHHLLFVAETGHPEEDAAVVEAGGAADAEQDEAGQEDQGLGEVHALVARVGASRARSSA